jgi:hypothetical protein
MRIDVSKIQKRIVRRDDRSLGIINYDIDNAYPQRVVDIVNGSGVAKTCVDIFFKFINGSGFVDAALGSRIVDGGKMTADKLLRRNVKDFAWIGGFAVHFNYDINGNKTTVNAIPFAHCRIAIDDDKNPVKIAVYPDWNREVKKRIEKKEIDFIDLFNPDPEKVKQEIEIAGGIENYKGQVYYHGADGELVYPLAYYDSELEDVETDSQIKLFKYRNISGSFMASHMFVRYGQSEGKDKDGEDGDLVDGLKSFQGADNFNRIMLIDVDTPEQKPELLPFNHQNNDKLFEYHETSTQNNIRKVFTIPTIFLDAIAGSLGMSKELDEAVTFYNRMTQDERAVIEETYAYLFGDIITGSFKIKQLTMQAMSTDPSADADAETAAKIADAQSVLRGSVGGVTALITLQQSISAGTTSVDAGVAMLREIYGFTNEVAREMLQGVEEQPLIDPSLARRV